MNEVIKFGTDGWRAIIAQEYTVDNVTRIAEGTAKWIIQQGGKTAVIGHDCRFGGQLFAETTARVFGAYGIKSYLAKGIVSTPMVSLGAVKLDCFMGIVITASHNPPSYNGFKLKSKLGGPTLEHDVKAVEALIPDNVKPNLPTIEALTSKGLIAEAPLEDMYVKHVEDHFDMKLLRQFGPTMAYDAMYGAGQNALKRILPNAHLMHCSINPSFHGQAPEPLDRNCQELANYIKAHDNIKCGLANDGDADRIGMFDEDGVFIDSHHLLLLLLIYMKEYKKMNGSVVVSFSVTDKLQKLAESFGLDYKVTKIGFKYIAEVMTKEEVLVGGEESGGLAVAGHIPERDGIWTGLLILEYMAQTNKTLKELVQDLYKRIGSFAFTRDDLHLTQAQKDAAIAKCKAGGFDQFGGYKIMRCEDLDGFKYFLEDDAWIMIRPSGTEPVLRVYCQASDYSKVRHILDEARTQILN